MKWRYRVLLSVLIVCALGVSWSTGSDAAPLLEEWSAQVTLSPAGVRANYPDIVTDVTGRVHVLWRGNLNYVPACDYDAVLYTVLMDGVWSEPQDVLVSPGGRCMMEYAVAVGPSDGRLHVVYSDYQLYHSWAPADHAGSAGEWSVPVAIGPQNARSPDVVVDDGNRIHVAFFLGPPEWEVYYTRSGDGGAHWMPPQHVHTAPPDYRVEIVELAIDGHGRLHLVWTEELMSPDVARGGTVFYTRSTDGGETWEPPLVIDEKDSRYREDYGAGEIAIVTVGVDQVHLVWAGAPESDRWHQWSSDGGATWHPARLIASSDVLGGRGLRRYNGGMDMAVDSAGRVHLISSSDELVHVVWENGGWSDLDIVALYNPLWPRIAVSQGNRLHLVAAFLPDQPQVDWREAVSVWHMSAQTDAPEVPSSSLPVLPGSESVITPTEEAVVESETVIAPTANISRLDGLPDEGGLRSSDPWIPVVLGIAPVVLIVLLTIGLRLRQQG